MKVTSLLFFAASFLSALVFRRLPRKWANLWLLVLSVGFIATWSWQFVIVLVVFTLINYWLAQKVGRSETARGRWSTAGIIFNVGLLFLLKYSSYYQPALSNALSAMGLTHSESLVSILLPVGLSFLILQAISTLLDIKNHRVAAESDLVRFAIYMLYFPKLLSGPIERQRQFIPRLESPLPLDSNLLERSFALVLIGLFRKIVIADPLFNMIPANAFITPLDFSGQNLVLWLLAYSFALYNDFAGYTNIIRGVSLWFGIELTNNFNLPYYSHNFTEFWTRWHISLSQWLRDYIFFPTARTLMRRFTPREHWINLVVPPLLTMLVSGAWHGLTLNLIIWGILHGLYQVIERIFALRKKEGSGEKPSLIRQRLSTAITFILATLTWVPFRMPVVTAVQYFQGMLHWVRPEYGALKLLLQGVIPSTVWSQVNIPNPLLLLILAVAILFDRFQAKGKREEFILDWSRLQIILFVVILAFVTLLAAISDQVTPFVYQGF